MDLVKFESNNEIKMPTLCELPLEYFFKIFTTINYVSRGESVHTQFKHKAYKAITLDTYLNLNHVIII